MKKKVIVFGVGKELKKMIRRNLLLEYDIVAFCDNDETKWDSYCFGKNIISPCKLKDMVYEEILISSRKFESEIRKQLEEMGVSKDIVNLIETPEDKYEGELDFWRERFKSENEKFKNEHYKNIMLAMAQEKDASVGEGKVIADFGCGPRGSLSWTNSPKIKIGIDVLATKYWDEFGNCLMNHGMIYVMSTEKYIPLGTESVDCLCTINSLDHVNDLEKMCCEILRILKSGGVLLGSFNLNEKRTECEPQTLTEEKLQEVLLKYFNIESYRVAYKESDDTYKNFYENNLVVDLAKDEEAILWVKAVKK